MSRELLINILKFAAIAVGAVAGIYGQFHDPRDKNANKLTQGGRWIIGLIIVTGMLAGILQYLDILDQEQKNKLAREENARTLVRNLELLSNVERSINPLKDLTFEIDMAIPLKAWDTLIKDPSYQRYRKRLINFSELQMKRDQNNYLYFNIYRNLFPDSNQERLPYLLLKHYTADVEIYKTFDQKKYNQGNRQPDLNFVLDFPTANKANHEFQSLGYYYYTNELHIVWGIDISSDRMVLSGKIQSLLDLEQSTLLLSFDNDERYLHNYSVPIKQTMQAIAVSNIHLKINGRKLKIKDMKRDHREPYPISYRFQFPKDLQKLNDDLYEF